MKTKFILLLVIFIGFSSLAKCDEMETDTTAMSNLIKDIIDSPVNMLHTMSNNNSIDCSKILNLFKQEESRLINFTWKIARLKCDNFMYLGIDVYPNNKYDKIYVLYYVKNDGNTESDMIKFSFAKKDNKIIFRGVSEPID